EVAFPVSFADSIAAATSTRATTARRTSSADGPSSLTNAATSQDDIRMRAPPTFTVVIDRPREGGVAINCSQICSMQVSKSSAAPGSTSAVPEALDASFDFTLGLEPLTAGTGLFAGVLGFKTSTGAFLEAFCAAEVAAFARACFTSLRKPSRFSKI